MPVFPKREAEVLVLATKMISGYTTSPAVFPHADVPALQAALDACMAAKDLQVEREAQFRLATEDKDAKLELLVADMKKELTQSEVDTAADPAQLGLIGWGPKAPAQPSAPPGQPRNLDPIVQGPGNLLLDWKQPASGTGGPVRTYLIERREQVNGGAFNEWHQIAIALETEVHLSGEPRNQQLEYRDLAINNGGNSVPSNTAAVVL